MKIFEKTCRNYACEYCGQTCDYDTIRYHETHCCKNPAAVAVVKAMEGKIYKLDNGAYIKVLKANETWESDEFCLPFINNRPLVIAEIKPNNWKSMDEWCKSLGFPITLGVDIYTSYANYNLDKMVEVTQEEWDAAVRLIAEKAMKI